MRPYRSESLGIVSEEIITPMKKLEPISPIAEGDLHLRLNCSTQLCNELSSVQSTVTLMEGLPQKSCGSQSYYFKRGSSVSVQR